MLTLSRTRHVLFLAVGLLLLFVFHPAAFTDQTEAQFWAHEDGSNVIGAYRVTLSLSDAWRWWYGPGIHTCRLYRPLASMLYAFNAYAGGRIGYWFPNALTIAQFLLCLWLSGLFAVRLSERNWALWLPLAMTPFQMELRTVPDDWLVWWVIQDQLLCLAFWLLALISYDRWLERRLLRDAVLTVSSVLLACLTKELAYLLPFSLLALCLYRQPFQRRFLMPVMGAVVMVAIVFVLRATFVPDPYVSGENVLSVVKGNFWVVAAKQAVRVGAMPALRSIASAPGQALLGLLQFIAVALIGLAVWYFRRPSSAIASTLLFALCWLAAPDFNPVHRYALLPLFMACAMVAIAIVALVQGVRIHKEKGAATQAGASSTKLYIHVLLSAVMLTGAAAVMGPRFDTTPAVVPGSWGGRTAIALAPIAAISRGVSVAQQLRAPGDSITGIRLLLTTFGRVNSGRVRLGVAHIRNHEWRDVRETYIEQAMLADNAFHHVAFRPAIATHRGESLRVTLSASGDEANAIGWWSDPLAQLDGQGPLTVNGTPRRGLGQLELVYGTSTGPGMAWYRVKAALR